MPLPSMVFVVSSKLRSFRPFAPAAHGELLVRAPGRCKLMSAGFEAFKWTLVFKKKVWRMFDAECTTLD